MDQVWAWNTDFAPRWLLVDEGSSGVDGSDVALALCAEIDGLFVAPEPPPAPEHYTLIGCDPTGPLREVLPQAGTDRAWLAAIVLDPVHDPQKPPPRGCQRYEYGCSCMEELCDVTVLGHRPSQAGPGLMDIDLRGYLRILPEHHWPPQQPPAAQAFLLTDHDENTLGRCQSTTGIFHQRPRPTTQPVTLLGCRPTAPLRALLSRKSAQRRHLRAMIHAVDQYGRAVPMTHMVSATVTSAHPSPLGADLVDITLDDGIHDPLPTGARTIWQLWHTGRPTHPNLWTDHDRALRHQWSGAALTHHPHTRPNQPPGRTYHLDGSSVTDIEGFYCALGEAINGPGGYFGWNLTALDDCLHGRWGAEPPFRLNWHHSDVARHHLAPGYDRPAYAHRNWGPATTLQNLLDILTNARINVDLQ